MIARELPNHHWDEFRMNKDQTRLMALALTVSSTIFSALGAALIGQARLIVLRAAKTWRLDAL
jgi:hypothetical protein